MCEYRQIEKDIPFPRVDWISQCGFELVVIEGYKRDLDYGITASLNLPIGKCIKCGEEIEAHEEGKNARV